MNNYALLGTWWHLRAALIQSYRRFRADHGDAVLNTRLDYDHIVALAEAEPEATVFTELREHTPVGGRHAVVNIGSLHQRFAVFLPNVEDGPNRQTIELLANRYLAGDLSHPRRSYAYVTGRLKIFPPGSGTPEIVVAGPSQVQDDPPTAP